MARSQNSDGRPQFHLRRISHRTLSTAANNVCFSDRITFIGRGDNVHYLVSSAAWQQRIFLSRRHCRLVRSQADDSHRLIDSSMTGVYVNDVKIAGSCVLEEGDVVTFGHPKGDTIQAGTRVRQPDSEHQFVFEACSCTAENHQQNVVQAWSQKRNKQLVGAAPTTPEMLGTFRVPKTVPKKKANSPAVLTRGCATQRGAAPLGTCHTTPPSSRRRPQTRSQGRAVGSRSSTRPYTTQKDVGIQSNDSSLESDTETESTNERSPAKEKPPGKDKRKYTQASRGQSAKQTVHAQSPAKPTESPSCKNPGQNELGKSVIVERTEEHTDDYPLDLTLKYGQTSYDKEADQEEVSQNGCESQVLTPEVKFISTGNTDNNSKEAEKPDQGSQPSSVDVQKEGMQPSAQFDDGGNAREKQDERDTGSIAQQDQVVRDSAKEVVEEEPTVEIKAGGDVKEDGCSPVPVPISSKEGVEHTLGHSSQSMEYSHPDQSVLSKQSEEQTQNVQGLVGHETKLPPPKLVEDPVCVFQHELDERTTFQTLSDNRCEEGVQKTEASGFVDPNTKPVEMTRVVSDHCYSKMKENADVLTEEQEMKETSPDKSTDFLDLDATVQSPEPVEDSSKQAEENLSVEEDHSLEKEEIADLVEDDSTQAKDNGLIEEDYCLEKKEIAADNVLTDEQEIMDPLADKTSGVHTAAMSPQPVEDSSLQVEDNMSVTVEKDHSVKKEEIAEVIADEQEVEADKQTNEDTTAMSPQPVEDSSLQVEDTSNVSVTVEKDHSFEKEEIADVIVDDQEIEGPFADKNTDVDTTAMSPQLVEDSSKQAEGNVSVEEDHSLENKDITDVISNEQEIEGPFADNAQNWSPCNPSSEMKEKEIDVKTDDFTDAPSKNMTARQPEDETLPEGEKKVANPISTETTFSEEEDFKSHVKVSELVQSPPEKSDTKCNKSTIHVDDTAVLVSEDVPVTDTMDKEEDDEEVILSYASQDSITSPYPRRGEDGLQVSDKCDHPVFIEPACVIDEEDPSISPPSPIMKDNEGTTMDDSTAWVLQEFENLEYSPEIPTVSNAKGASQDLSQMSFTPSVPTAENETEKEMIPSSQGSDRESGSSRSSDSHMGILRLSPSGRSGANASQSDVESEESETPLSQNSTGSDFGLSGVVPFLASPTGSQEDSLEALQKEAFAEIEADEDSETLPTSHPTQNKGEATTIASVDNDTADFKKSVTWEVKDTGLDTGTRENDDLSRDDLEEKFGDRNLRFVVSDSIDYRAEYDNYSDLESSDKEDPENVEEVGLGLHLSDSEGETEERRHSSQSVSWNKGHSGHAQVKEQSKSVSGTLEESSEEKLKENELSDSSRFKDTLSDNFQGTSTQLAKPKEQGKEVISLEEIPADDASLSEVLPSQESKAGKLHNISEEKDDDAEEIETEKKLPDVQSKVADQTSAESTLSEMKPGKLHDVSKEEDIAKETETEALQMVTLPERKDNNPTLTDSTFSEMKPGNVHNSNEEVVAAKEMEAEQVSQRENSGTSTEITSSQEQQDEDKTSGSERDMSNPHINQAKAQKESEPKTQLNMESEDESVAEKQSRKDHVKIHSQTEQEAAVVVDQLTCKASEVLPSAKRPHDEIDAVLPQSKRLHLDAQLEETDKIKGLTVVNVTSEDCENITENSPCGTEDFFDAHCEVTKNADIAADFQQKCVPVVSAKSRADYVRDVVSDFFANRFFINKMSSKLDEIAEEARKQKVAEEVKAFFASPSLKKSTSSSKDGCEDISDHSSAKNGREGLTCDEIPRPQVEKRKAIEQAVREFFKKKNFSAANKPEDTVSNETEINCQTKGTALKNAKRPRLQEVSEEIVGLSSKNTPEVKRLQETSQQPMDSAEVTTDSAEVTTDSAEVATDSAEVATDSAEVATDSAEVATDSAEVATDSADVATDSADVATDSADVATDSAEVATDSAEVATDSADVATDSAEVTTDSAEVTTDSAEVTTDSAEVTTDSAEEVNNSKNDTSPLGTQEFNTFATIHKDIKAKTNQDEQNTTPGHDELENNNKEVGIPDNRGLETYNANDKDGKETEMSVAVGKDNSDKDGHEREISTEEMDTQAGQDTDNKELVDTQAVEVCSSTESDSKASDSITVASENEKSKCMPSASLSAEEKVETLEETIKDIEEDVVATKTQDDLSGMVTVTAEPSCQITDTATSTKDCECEETIPDTTTRSTLSPNEIKVVQCQDLTKVPSKEVMLSDLTEFEETSHEKPCSSSLLDKSTSPSSCSKEPSQSDLSVIEETSHEEPSSTSPLDKSTSPSSCSKEPGQTSQESAVPEVCNEEVQEDSETDANSDSSCLPSLDGYAESDRDSNCSENETFLSPKSIDSYAESSDAESDRESDNSENDRFLSSNSMEYGAEFDTDKLADANEDVTKETDKQSNEMSLQGLSCDFDDDDEFSAPNINIDDIDFDDDNFDDESPSMQTNSDLPSLVTNFSSGKDVSVKENSRKSEMAEPEKKKETTDKTPSIGKVKDNPAAQMTEETPGVLPTNGQDPPPGSHTRRQALWCLAMLEYEISRKVTTDNAPKYMEQCQTILASLQQTLDKEPSLKDISRVQAWKKEAAKLSLVRRCPFLRPSSRWLAEDLNLEPFDSKVNNPNHNTIIPPNRKEAAKLGEKMFLPETIIAVVGDTGAGKSSLMNALLDHSSVLPTSGMRACTAVVVEVSNNDRNKNYEADVEFLSRKEWDDELRLLLTDLIGEDGKAKRKPDPQSEAGIAWSKIKAVYGRVESYDVLSRLPHVRHLLGTTKHISKSRAREFRSEIDKYVDSMDAPPARGPGARDRSGGQLWPIVKRVKVQIPNCDVCSSGAILVDLPGVRDSNAARDNIAKQYFKNCNAIWIVASIHRAVDDKTAKELLGEGFRRQLLMDGQYGSIAFICTKTDDLRSVQQEVNDLKEEVFELEQIVEPVDIAPDEEVIIDDNDREKLTSLRTTLEEKQISEQEKKTDLKETRLHIADKEKEIAGVDRQVCSKQRQMSVMCAKARNQYSQTQIRADFKAGIRVYDFRVDCELCRHWGLSRRTGAKQNCAGGVEERRGRSRFFAGAKQNGAGAKQNGGGEEEGVEDQDEEDIARGLRVFTVSSTEYLKLTNKLTRDGPAQVFSSVQDTQIPALREFVHEMTNVRRQSGTEKLIRSLGSFVSDIASYLLDEGTKNHGTRMSAKTIFEHHLGELKTSLQPVLGTLQTDVDRSISICIHPKLKEGVQAAASMCQAVSKKWGAPTCKENRQAGGLHYSTYKATVRRSGVYKSPTYGPIDMNEDLSSPLYNTITISWQKVFDNGTLFFSLDNCKQSVLRTLKDFLLKLRTELQALGMDADRVNRVGQQQLNSTKMRLDNAVAELKEFITGQQREISRVMTPAVQNRMEPVYETCTNEAGPGSFNRMRNHMDVHVAYEKDIMFDQASQILLKQLADLEVDIVARMQVLCDQLCEDLAVLYEPFWEAPVHCTILKKHLMDDMLSIHGKVKSLFEDAELKDLPPLPEPAPQPPAVNQSATGTSYSFMNRPGSSNLSTGTTPTCINPVSMLTPTYPVTLRIKQELMHGCGAATPLTQSFQYGGIRPLPAPMTAPASAPAVAGMRSGPSASRFGTPVPANIHLQQGSVYAHVTQPHIKREENQHVGCAGASTPLLNPTAVSQFRKRTLQGMTGPGNSQPTAPPVLKKVKTEEGYFVTMVGQGGQVLRFPVVDTMAQVQQNRNSRQTGAAVGTFLHRAATPATSRQSLSTTTKIGKQFSANATPKGSVSGKASTYSASKSVTSQGLSSAKAIGASSKTPGKGGARGKGARGSQVSVPAARQQGWPAVKQEPRSPLRENQRRSKRKFQPDAVPIGKYCAGADVLRESAGRCAGLPSGECGTSSGRVRYVLRESAVRPAGECGTFCGSQTFCSSLLEQRKLEVNDLRPACKQDWTGSGCNVKGAGGFC
ncbi:hypothetical protein Bbelb_029960 [Branchiostoma belcheri]|nr:hypothetical protein Bbelb_029960 [Branchiostoma belcheri]